jgi:hypothetical protein
MSLLRPTRNLRARRHVIRQKNARRVLVTLAQRLESARLPPNVPGSEQIPIRNPRLEGVRAGRAIFESAP